ncbi:anaphase-promoting complex subunit CDC26-like [Glandiceps talaboti]
MIKRRPTRIEMTLDDLKEFEAVKKEVEQRKKQREMNAAAAAGGGGGGTATLDVATGSGVSDPKSRQKEINERIGYDPKTVTVTSSRIGELRGGN